MGDGDGQAGGSGPELQHTPDTVIHDQGSLSLQAYHYLLTHKQPQTTCQIMCQIFKSPATSCPCLVTTTVTQMSITPTTLSPSTIAETHLRVQTSPGWAGPPPPPRPLVAGPWVKGGTEDSQAP